MKKGFLMICLIGCALMVQAAPPGGAPPRRGGPGPHRGGHGGPGNDGVLLAAGITAIVANSLGILNELTAPRSYCVPSSPQVVTPVYVPPEPVYTAPVYTAPVYTVPVYRAPVYRPAPPPRRYCPPGPGGRPRPR